MSKPVFDNVGIQMPTEDCPVCRGTRSVPSGHVDAWGRPVGRACGECDGTGYVFCHPSNPLWDVYEIEHRNRARAAGRA